MLSQMQACARLCEAVCLSGNQFSPSAVLQSNFDGFICSQGRPHRRQLDVVLVGTMGRTQPLSAFVRVPAASFWPSASSAREPESSKHRTAYSRDPAARAHGLGRVAAGLRAKTTRGDYWIPALARKGSLGRNDGREVTCISTSRNEKAGANPTGTETLRRAY